MKRIAWRVLSQSPKLFYVLNNDNSIYMTGYLCTTICFLSKAHVRVKKHRSFLIELIKYQIKPKE